jgi:hypothetical protein
MRLADRYDLLINQLISYNYEDHQSRFVLKQRLEICRQVGEAAYMHIAWCEKWQGW